MWRCSQLRGCGRVLDASGTSTCRSINPHPAVRMCSSGVQGGRSSGVVPATSSTPASSRRSTASDHTHASPAQLNDPARSRLFRMLSEAAAVGTHRSTGITATAADTKASMQERCQSHANTPHSPDASSCAPAAAKTIAEKRQTTGRPPRAGEPEGSHASMRQGTADDGPFVIPATIRTTALMSSVQGIVCIMNQRKRDVDVTPPLFIADAPQENASPPLPEVDGEEAHAQEAAMPPGMHAHYEPLRALQLLCVRTLRTCTERSSDGGGGARRRLASIAPARSSQPLCEALSAFLCAVMDHPVLQGSLMGYVPSWEALANTPPTVASNVVDAPETQAAALFVVHCPSSLVLSLYAAVNAIYAILVETDAGTHSADTATVQEHGVHRLHSRLSDQAARLITLWVIAWGPAQSLPNAALPPLLHGNADAVAASCSSATALRTFHLLRNAARLRNGWQRRSRLGVEERVMAATVLCLLLRTASDPRSFQQVQRTALFCDVAVDLYALVGANPTRVAPSDEAAPVLHRTVHAALNNRLHMTEITASVVSSQRGCVQRHGDDASCVTLSIPARIVGTHADVVILPAVVVGCLVDTVQRHVLEGCVAHWSPSTALRYQKQCVQLALSIEADLATMDALRGHIVLVTDASTACVMHPMSSHGASNDPRQRHKKDATGTAAAASLSALRRAIASAVLRIALALSPSTELSRDAPPSDALRCSPFRPHQRKDGHANLVPVVCTFLRHLRHTFDPLVRRHYATSGGHEVLADALHAMFIGVMADEQLRPVMRRRRDPRYVKVCPGDVSVGTAMEMLYFTALLLRNAEGAANGSAVVLWKPTAERLFRFSADALVHNTRRHLGEASTPLASSPLDGPAMDEVVAAFFLVQEQYRRPTLVWMPLWQVTEWLFVVHVFYGALRTEVDGAADAVEGGAGSEPHTAGGSAKAMLLASLAPRVDRASGSNSAPSSDAVDAFGSAGAAEQPAEAAADSNVALLRTFAARRVHRLLDLARALTTLQDQSKDGTRRSHRGRGDVARRQKETSSWSPTQIRSASTIMRRLEGSPTDSSTEASAAAGVRGIRRFKRLSVLSANVGVDFNVVEERRQRAAGKQKKRRQGALKKTLHSTSGQLSSTVHEADGLATSGDAQSEGPPRDGDTVDDGTLLPPPTPLGNHDVGSSTGRLTVLVARRADGGSFGFSTTAQCVVDDIARGDAFSAAVEALGWYASDVVGMRVVRVNHTDIATLDDLVQAVRALPRGPKVRFTLEAVSAGGGDGAAR